jgi:hypothetical protein
LVRLPTHLNPDSVLEQAVGQYKHVVIVGVDHNDELSFREGGDNPEHDLAIPFWILSKVCHKIMNGDYDG